MTEPIVESSGNVFVDLGFPPAEAAILQMRAKLMADLQAFIRSSGLTEAQTAERLGVTQSRVSELMRGKWDRFSLETLITLETHAGRALTLEFTA